MRPESRIVTTRPPVPRPTIDSPTFFCPYLYEQVVDATVSQVTSDGVTVRLVRDNADGSAVVRIEH